MRFRSPVRTFPLARWLGSEGEGRARRWGIALLALLGTAALALGFGRVTLHGVVSAAPDGGPVAGAVVRFQGEANYTLTDDQGGFALSVPLLGASHLTAWAPGFFIGSALAVVPGAITLTLDRHPVEDHAGYTFVSPILDPDAPGACVRCHGSRSDEAAALPVDEWLADAHAGSAVSPRFLSVYNGTTLDGAPGALTVYRFDADLGVDVPVAPSLGQDGVGVGFRLDFPNAAGSCAACHVPILALQEAHNADPNAAEGVAAEGVTCDFCHKIAGVRLDDDGRPSPHLPGAASLDLLRPPPGEQIFFGPLDDTPGDDVYAPLYDQSQFCAACHSGQFWGVSIYNSFGEWLDSPYSDSLSGKTCQDCHMPPVGTTTFVDLPPDATQHVPQRDPATIFSHRMPGAADAALLAAAAALTVETDRSAGEVGVTVTVINSGAGHDLPTDSPLRGVILRVEAVDADMQPLALIDGPILPDWAGIGAPADGYYAGLPGVYFAKILADAATGESPTSAYWRQTRLVSDNRIGALQSAVSRYRFRAPAAGAIHVTAHLLLRRAFIDQMALKGWDTPDLPMAHVTRVIP